MATTSNDDDDGISETIAPSFDHSDSGNNINIRHQSLNERSLLSSFGGNDVPSWHIPPAYKHSSSSYLPRAHSLNLKNDGDIHHINTIIGGNNGTNNNNANGPSMASMSSMSSMSSYITNGPGVSVGPHGAANHRLETLSYVHAPCWCDVCGLLVVAAREPSMYCTVGCGYRVHQHCRQYVPSSGGCIDLQSEEESWQLVADNEWRMPASTAIWMTTPHLLAAMLRYLREDDLCIIRCSHSRLRQAVDRKPIWADLGFRFLHIPSLFNFNQMAAPPVPASSIRLSSVTATTTTTSSSSSSSSSSISTTNNVNIPDFAIALSLGLDPPRLPAAITIAIHAPLNIRDKMYSWLFGPEFCEQYRAYINRADMHLRAKLKVGGAIIPILVFMAPPEEESWIRTKYDGHLIVLDATADGLVEEQKEQASKPNPDEFDGYDNDMSHTGIGSGNHHQPSRTTTARERYNETKVGLMNRIKEVGRHQGHEPHVAFIALVNKMDQSTLSPVAATTTTDVAATSSSSPPSSSISGMTDGTDPFTIPEVDRSDEVTCFLALVHLAREVRESQGFSLIPGNVNSAAQGEMPTPGERVAEVSKDLSKVAGQAVKVAGCVPLFVVGHGLLNLPLYSLVGVGVGAGTGWFTVDHKVQRALPKQLHFLSKPAALGGGLIGGVCGLGVFGLAGLGLTLMGGLNDGMELALKGRVTATGGASMPLHLILSEMTVGQPQ